MNWNPLKRSDPTLAAGLLLACTLALLSFHFGSQAQRQIPETHRLHLIRDRIASASCLVAESEAGQRGLVITGDESYLGPAESSVADLRRLINDLRTLATHNDAQPPLERLPALEARLEGKLAASQEIVDAYRQGGLDAARQLLRSDRGRKATEEIQRRLRQMEEQTILLLEQSLATLQHDLDASRWLTAGAALLTALAFLCANPANRDRTPAAQ